MTDVIDEGPVAQGHASGELVADAEGGSLSGTSGSDILGTDMLIGDEDKVVSARGTEDGLVLRIDGGAEWPKILADLESFLGGRRKFFDGGEVSIEWLERLPSREQCSELEELLKSQYGLTVVTRRKRPPHSQNSNASQNVKAGQGSEGVAADSAMKGPQEKASERSGGIAIPLFDERISSASILGSGVDDVGSEDMSLVERIEQLAAGRDGDSFDVEGDDAGLNPGRRRMNQVRKMLGEDLFYEDDANAKVVFGTLRSGQRIETPFSLVVIGDVNPGADLVAGGDIVILGSLRGTAHASAYDDDAFDSVIIAMQMQPMQLRIGSIISRGSDDVVAGVEIARIENRRIVVESFNPRTPLHRKSY